MDELKYQGSHEFVDQQGSVEWTSPSNIALTKYWGKHGEQLPRNPSISFTLDAARTTTLVSFSPADQPEFEFLFEGEKAPAFAKRITQFLTRYADHFPYIPAFSWKVESSNSFPHSSGIASSASAMSALMMCFVDIEERFFHAKMTDQQRLQRVSYLSRLASGSASRSVYPKLGQWGAHDDIDNSSDLYAIPMGSILHSSFEHFHDDILIVSAEEKSVSSSAGHQLMNGNPYAEARFEQAGRHTVEMIEVLKSGDLDAFIRIVESEALTLHALMMCSQPSYMLMKPNTIQVIDKIRAFRHSTKTPICFTLDAGPNVHILYPDAFAHECQHFIHDQLIPLAHEGRVISDQLGMGPQRIR